MRRDGCDDLNWDGAFRTFGPSWAVGFSLLLQFNSKQSEKPKRKGKWTILCNFDGIKIKAKKDQVGFTEYIWKQSAASIVHVLKNSDPTSSTLQLNLTYQKRIKPNIT